MDPARLRRLLWLVGVPCALRLLLVPFVQDFEADAYSRMQMAERIATALREGRPLLPTLYVPVWPPAWHLTCALVELVVANAYYVPKVLAAIFGGLTPALVWALARRVSEQPRVALIAWALVTVAPLHLLYSTSGMSEAFYGFWFVAAALAFVRAEPGNRWLCVAAAALVPASLTRFDNWILLAALAPLARWQRRASWPTLLASLAICALSPLGWFALNWRLTGNPLSFLATHRAYLDHFYAAYKYHALYFDRGPLGWALQLGALAATMGAFLWFGGWLTAWRVWRAPDHSPRRRDARALAAWLAISFLYLLAMWLLRRQVGWRRHYLAIGCGLAVFAAVGLGRVRRRVAVALVAADLLLTLGASAPFAWVPRRYAQAAAFLRAQEDKGTIYCDEPGVRVIAQLPPDRFVSDAPLGSPSETLAWMRARRVRWVVYSEVDYSPLGEIFPWMRAKESRPSLALAFDPPANHPLLPRLYVYASAPASE